MSFDVDVSCMLGGRAIGTRIVASSGLTVLWGPSGAGKTTILNMVAGLKRPGGGHVRVDGETMFDQRLGIDIPAHRRRIGYVFQDGRLFPHLRVKANLLYGYRLARPEHRWMTLDEVLSFLDIGPLVDRWPALLSGGEAQRVAIGRALLSGARALLLDEPLASIDLERRGGIIDVILRIRDELKLPMLYVTHDPAEAARLATQQVDIPLPAG